MKLHSVYSSHISDIGYDEETRELHVVYSNTGKRIVYVDVPPEIASKVLPQNAPSIGEAMHAHIRGRFSFRYLAEEG